MSELPRVACWIQMHPGIGNRSRDNIDAGEVEDRLGLIVCQVTEADVDARHGPYSCEVTERCVSYISGV